MYLRVVIPLTTQLFTFPKKVSMHTKLPNLGADYMVDGVEYAIHELPEGQTILPKMLQLKMD